MLFDIMAFKLWSELNKSAETQLRPDFGFRPWKVLTQDEKYKIWKYLQTHFFNKSVKGREGYQFYGDYNEKPNRQERILIAVDSLNDSYKAQSYAKRFLEDSDFDNACEDFFHILVEQDENVVFELLSLYAKAAIVKGNWNHTWQQKDESNKDFKKRVEEWNFIPFDNFAEDLNEVFGQFCVNIHLTHL